MSTTKLPRYKLAVGVQFDEQDAEQEAPTVGVKGMHVGADTVVQIARRYGVPVVEDPALARVLHQLELDQRVPSALYRSVAALLNYVRQCFRPR